MARGLSLSYRATAALFLLSTVACTRGVNIAPAQAPRLSVDTPDGVRVRTTEGETVAPEEHTLVVVPMSGPIESFRSPMKVELRPSPDGVGEVLSVEGSLAPSSAPCQRAQTPCPNSPGAHKATYDTRELQRLEVRMSSPEQTLGLTLGIVAVVGAVLALTIASSLGGFGGRGSYL